MTDQTQGAVSICHAMQSCPVLHFRRVQLANGFLLYGDLGKSHFKLNQGPFGCLYSGAWHCIALNINNL
jgi:hypothetical protein